MSWSLPLTGFTPAQENSCECQPIRTADAVYAVGLMDTFQSINFLKQTAPQGAFANIGTSLAGQTISQLANALNGTKLMCAAQMVSNQIVKVSVLDTATEKFDVDASQIYTGGSFTTTGISVAARDPDNFIVAMVSEGERIMGNTYFRILFATTSDAGVTFNTSLIAGTEQEISYISPRLVYNPKNGLTYCICAADRQIYLFVLTGGNSVDPPVITHEIGAGFDTPFTLTTPVGPGMLLTRGNTDILRFPFIGSSNGSLRVVGFDATAAPAVFTQSDEIALAYTGTLKLGVGSAVDGEIAYLSYIPEADTTQVLNVNDQGMDDWSVPEVSLLLPTQAIWHVPCAIYNALGGQKVLAQLACDNSLITYHEDDQAIVPPAETFVDLKANILPSAKVTANLDIAAKNPNPYAEFYELYPERYGKNRAGPKVINYYHWRVMLPTSQVRANYLFNVWGPQVNNTVAIIGGVYGWTLEELDRLSKLKEKICFEISDWVRDTWNVSEEEELRQSITAAGEDPDTLEFIIDDQGNTGNALVYMLRPDNPLRTTCEIVIADISEQNPVYQNAYDRLISEDVFPTQTREQVKGILRGMHFSNKLRYPCYHIVTENTGRAQTLEEWYAEIAEEYPHDIVLEARTGNWITEGASGGPNEPFEPEHVP